MVTSTTLDAEQEPDADRWILMTDGSSTSMSAAKYEALIIELMIAEGARVEKVLAKCDSQLIVNQVKGEYEALEKRMKTYASKARELLAGFKKANIELILRDDDMLADALTLGQKGFLIVAIDYSSKWVGIEAVTSITEKVVEKFGKHNIICRFGTPQFPSPITALNSTQKPSENFVKYLVYNKSSRQSRILRLMGKRRSPTKGSCTKSEQGYTRWNELAASIADLENLSTKLVWILVEVSCLGHSVDDLKNFRLSQVVPLVLMGINFN
ncbi:hypothetical protein CRG98_018012 [Punica granatum]|uniref:RNase H type-1 domain-containing protein n=1 Tax=Punica granatum TaxID=22663 RepID=A0A2I0K0H5_PUNGR|nr:hypothetical protein CRG98_018012 [Punica granatum]